MRTARVWDKNSLGMDKLIADLKKDSRAVLSKRIPVLEVWSMEVEDFGAYIRLDKPAWRWTDSQEEGWCDLDHVPSIEIGKPLIVAGEDLRGSLVDNVSSINLVYLEEDEASPITGDLKFDITVNVAPLTLESLQDHLWRHGETILKLNNRVQALEARLLGRR